MSKKTPEEKAVERAKKHLGEAIVKCRGSQWSQRQLALAIGLPPSNLKYIEDGVNAPTADVYARLIEKLTPSIAVRARMDRLYMTIRKAPPLDVCDVIAKNPDLLDVLRGLNGKQITKEQLEQMSILIALFPDTDSEGEMNHG